MLTNTRTGLEELLLKKIKQKDIFGQLLTVTSNGKRNKKIC